MLTGAALPAFSSCRPRSQVYGGSSHGRPLSEYLMTMMSLLLSALLFLPSSPEPEHHARHAAHTPLKLRLFGFRVRGPVPRHAIFRNFDHGFSPVFSSPFSPGRYRLAALLFLPSSPEPGQS